MVRKCFICNTEMRETTSELRTGWGKYELIIKGVKVHECPKCGERVYDPNEVEMIQNLSESFSMLKERPDILNVEEVADLLRVSNQTVYNMIKDGRLKAKKVGREWRFLRKEVENLINNENACSNDAATKISIAARGAEYLTENDRKILEKHLSDM